LTTQNRERLFIVAWLKEKENFKSDRGLDYEDIALMKRMI
jgi:site-specific DNA-cytosine methylase